MCARRPLSTKEILDAVRLYAEPGGTILHEDPEIIEETLLEICRHLVIKDLKLNEWKFPHASVIEYFEEMHRWDIGRAHSSVAKICLLFLIEGYTDQEALEAKEDAETAAEMRDDQRVVQNKKGIRYYIRDYWDIHVLALENSQPFEVEVANLLRNFLGVDRSPNQSSQQYRRWFLDRYRYPYREFMEDVSTIVSDGMFFEPIENPIFGICILGFCNLLKDYWTPGIDVMQINQHKADLLWLTISSGHLNLSGKLIELGLDVNRRLDPGGQSALHEVVAFGSIETVKFLLSKGADPNLLSLIGDSAMCIAT